MYWGAIRRGCERMLLVDGESVSDGHVWLVRADSVGAAYSDESVCARKEGRGQPLGVEAVALSARAQEAEGPLTVVG